MAPAALGESLIRMFFMGLRQLLFVSVSSPECQGGVEPEESEKDYPHPEVAAFPVGGVDGEDGYGIAQQGTADVSHEDLRSVPVPDQESQYGSGEYQKMLPAKEQEPGDSKEDGFAACVTVDAVEEVVEVDEPDNADGCDGVGDEGVFYAEESEVKGMQPAQKVKSRQGCKKLCQEACSGLKFIEVVQIAHHGYQHAGHQRIVKSVICLSPEKKVAQACKPGDGDGDASAVRCGDAVAAPIVYLGQKFVFDGVLFYEPGQAEREEEKEQIDHRFSPCIMASMPCSAV